MRAVLLAAMLAASATPALAAADLTGTSDGYTYFNRPGATMAVYEADIRECRMLSNRLHQPLPPTAGASLYVPAGTSVAAAGVGAAIGEAIALAIQQKMADAKGHPVNLENCMVVKGWRVVAINEAEAQVVQAMNKKDKAARFAEWVGAEDPHGSVVRTFANDAADNGAGHLFVAAHHTGTTLVADVKPAPDNTGIPMSAYLPLPSQYRLPRRAKTAKPPEPLKDADLGGVPDGQGLIVVTVAGDAEISLRLERVGGGPAAPAWVDGKPAEIIAGRSQGSFARSGAGGGATYVFAAPPGRWRIASLSVNWITVSFCLGSPAFDLNAGEAVFAGAFGPDRPLPDMAIEPAKAVFPGLSTVPALLKPAEWINGTQGQCEGAYLYALQVADRPFVNSYAFARAAPPTAAAVAAPAAPSTPPTPTPVAAPATPAAPPAVAPPTPTTGTAAAATTPG